MIIGNILNSQTQYLISKLLTNYNVISFFDYEYFAETQLHTDIHNILIFPIINSYDECKYSSIGWECAIKSAFEGSYTVTSIFLVSPNLSMLDNCIDLIHLFDDTCIIDNLWLWPDSDNTVLRNTDVANLPFQTKQHQYL